MIFRKVVQDWNEQTTSFQLDTTVAGRDAMVKNVAVNIGAERARYEAQTRIEGPGADVKMYSLTVAEENQEFDQRTFKPTTHPMQSLICYIKMHFSIKVAVFFRTHQSC